MPSPVQSDPFTLQAPKPKSKLPRRRKSKFDRQAQPGSQIDVGGSNFGTNSDVPIYLMPSARANLTNGSASILQEVPANESTAAAVPEGGYFLGDALSTPEGSPGLNNNGNTT